MKHYAITIKGRVQGVFFRKYTEEKANDLGIKGYVKNLPDGSVFIGAEGEEPVLKQLVEWCHKGSPASAVKEVVVEEKNLQGYTDFRITR